MTKKVLVFDLDGTLYEINTFHHFIKYVLRLSIKSFKFLLIIRILFFLSLRLIKLISHKKLKYLILKLTYKRPDIDLEFFVDKIEKYKKTFPFLEKDTFELKILATAAPDCYAKIIADRNRFDTCIATEFLGPEYKLFSENSKEEKLKRVLNYLDNFELKKVDTFVTDHIDDLPLLKVSLNNFIINPSEDFKRELTSHDIKYTAI